jgi:hypothetical protein
VLNPRAVKGKMHAFISKYQIHEIYFSGLNMQRSIIIEEG